MALNAFADKIMSDTNRRISSKVAPKLVEAIRKILSTIDSVCSDNDRLWAHEHILQMVDMLIEKR